MSKSNTTFPFRDVISGDIRGKSEAEMRDLCGRPSSREGDICVYRFGRSVPEGTLGDPRSVVIQIWMVEGRAGHAWLHLHFADGLDYHEVLW